MTKPRKLTLPYQYTVFNGTSSRIKVHYQEAAPVDSEENDPLPTSKKIRPGNSLSLLRIQPETNVTVRCLDKVDEHSTISIQLGHDIGDAFELKFFSTSDPIETAPPKGGRG